MKQLKKIPKFRSEKEEAEFWATHDSAEYIDYSKAKRAAFPNLKKKSILSIGGIAKDRKQGLGDEREYVKKVIAKKIASDGS